MSAKTAPTAALEPDQEERLISDLLRAEPLRKHKMPRWLHSRLRSLPDNLIGARYFGPGRQAWMVRVCDWLDHWGYYVNERGDEIFVSEPYDADQEDLREMANFADQIGAKLYARPVSAHYPGHTLRFEFWPRPGWPA